MNGPIGRELQLLEGGILHRGHGTERRARQNRAITKIRRADRHCGKILKILPSLRARDETARKTSDCKKYFNFIFIVEKKFKFR